MLLVVDVWWLSRYRASAVPEYDESGYMAIALRDYRGLNHGGVLDLVREYVDQTPEAPLVPLLAVAVFAVTDPGVGVAVAVQLASLVVLAAATYGLARRLMPDRWAALAAGVTVALPVVSDYTRVFHFAVPAAACFTTAAWALVRSNGLQEHRWAVTAGVFLGLTVLARTMTIAFVPGFALAVVALAARPAHRGARLRGALWLGAAAALVASTWYLPHGNFLDVARYLRGAGYGTDSASYGDAYSPLSAGYWLKQLRLMATAELHLAPLLVILAGLVAAGTRRRPRQVLTTLRHHDIVVPVALALEGYAALTSSRNAGTAFSLPWVPCLVVVAVAGASRVRPNGVRRAFAAGFVFAALLAVVTKSDAVPALADRHAIRIPGFATVPITDGNWLARRDVAATGVALPGPAHPLPAVHREWLPFLRAEAGAALPADGPRTLLVATGDVVVSTTRFALAAELAGRGLLPVERLRPAPTAEQYGDQMAASRAVLLVTADPPPSGGDLDAEAVLEAARDNGFVPFRTSVMPDGRTLTWWRRG